MSIVQNVTNVLTGATITDQAIASDLLAGGKLGAITLTLATLESATPTLRQFFQDSLNECLAEHAAISALAQARGWYQAYESPEAQMALAVTITNPVAQAASPQV